MIDRKDHDQFVYQLYEQLLEIEQRLIPTGLHVFGSASKEAEVADMLRMVASFDRPEYGTRSLPDLIAEALSLPSYSTLLNESTHSEDNLRRRERVETLTRASIAKLLSNGVDQAAALLYQEASVPVE